MNNANDSSGGFKSPDETTDSMKDEKQVVSNSSKVFKDEVLKALLAIYLLSLLFLFSFFGSFLLFMIHKLFFFNSYSYGMVLKLLQAKQVQCDVNVLLNKKSHLEVSFNLSHFN